MTLVVKGLMMVMMISMFSCAIQCLMHKIEKMVSFFLTLVVPVTCTHCSVVTVIQVLFSLLILHGVISRWSHDFGVTALKCDCLYHWMILLMPLHDLPFVCRK